MQPDLCGYCPELVQPVTSRTHTAWRSTAFGRFPALLRPLPSFLQPAGQRFLSNCCFIIFFNLLWAKKAEKDACSDRAQCKNEQAPQKEGVAILDATWSKPKQLLCFPGWLFLQGSSALSSLRSSRLHPLQWTLTAPSQFCCARLILLTSFHFWKPMRPPSLLFKTSARACLLARPFILPPCTS